MKVSQGYIKKKKNQQGNEWMLYAVANDNIEGPAEGCHMH